MAKSRRSKIVSLTKASKKSREQKGQLVDQIREAVQQYQHIWLFDVENMRNTFFKQVRLDMREDGRIFFGKNKVMAKALETDELSPGLHQLAEKLVGDVGLLFTNQAPQQTIDYFRSFSETDFARTGCTATRTVVIRAEDVERSGGLRKLPDPGSEEPGEMVSATAEPQLRQCGLPTKLRGGSILLAVDQAVVCEEGSKITADQSRILKILGAKMAEFKVCLLARYHSGTLYEYVETTSQLE